MIENVLEIFVFTYNRAEHLARTLQQFVNSPFRQCSITILDNHSTDHTPKVCQKFTEAFPKLRIVRHPKNIGGLANYLRAVELSRLAYTWIICDDDQYQFELCDDVRNALVDESFDLISIGVEGHELPSGYNGKLQDFASMHPFFLGHSFVPALIFRTELFNEEMLRKGYDNIETMFPHFPFLASLVDRNCKIYVSQNKIISKSNNVGYSTFRFLTGWIQSCRKIQNVSFRSKAISEVFGGNLAIKNLVYCILTERSFRPAAYWSEYKELISTGLLLSPWLFLKIAFFLPLLFLPDFAHRFLWAIYKNYRQRSQLPLPNFDEKR